MADEQLTEQEIFDTVAKHLIKQGAPARISTVEGISRCTYGTWDGPKCAVGCLFTREEFQPGEIVSVFEPIGFWLDVVKEVPGMVPERLRGFESLLGALQKCHDDYMLGDTWRKGLERVAKDFNLKTRAIDNAYANR